MISAYQKEATSALQNKQSSVKDQIDRLTDIADAVKSDLKAKVDAEYQAAADNVAKTQTPDDIDAAQKNGIKKMDDVLAEATGLNQAITDNQKKLDDAAQAAVNQINKTDMTDADKQQAISAINAARDTAKINVGLADAVDVAKAAEAKGEEVIMGAVDKASQADLKNAKKAKAAEVEQVAAEAKQKIDDAYNKLTDAEKATAKADYDQAIKAIDDAATAAKT
ncbi:DUF1542 domain-containing protein, partial [Lactobacillus sp. XV13L]|nr:DUF1542 domain-containing protein [Lactobacillus sp. XV13L]